jgi:hypothetical protein
MRTLCLALLLTGCGADFIGDPSKPAEVQILLLDGSLMLDEASPGATALLEPPPQGGYVIYVGVRASGVEASGLRITGELHDVDTDTLVGVDTRRTKLLRDSDGWGRTSSDPIGLANISPCPDYTMKDVHDQRYNLTVTITDGAHRTASSTVAVVPRCQLADSALQRECLCVCSADYMQGKCAS